MLIFATMTSVCVPVFAIDENDFYTKLEEFKKNIYSNGSHYIDNPSLTGGYQCFGFANELAIYMFGSYPTKSMAANGDPRSGWEITYYVGDNDNIITNPIDNLTIGDIVRYKCHSIFITDISNDSITYCDANSDKKIR